MNAQGTEETDKIDDPMLLAEILEAREELEEAETPEQVDRIRQANIGPFSTHFFQMGRGLQQLKAESDCGCNRARQGNCWFPRTSIFRYASRLG